MFLDSKLDFKEHIQNVLNKVSKTIGLLCQLQKILPRPPLITIYKSFIRTYLDYGDIICDQAYNISFYQKLESIQYNATQFRDHKFKHNFQYNLNPICNCCEDIETLCYYLFHCSLYTHERLALLNVIQGIDNSILELADSHIAEVSFMEENS